MNSNTFSLTKNNIFSKSVFEIELVGGDQVVAAIGRGGLHELETRYVLLASIATSAFNEVYSPRFWLGKSLLAI